ncbi:MAG TPA: NYN domain-containing protein [Anaerolineaceae bacterium]|nr:NYN domain-containing protein [Anaerolineaceae bacterium]
MGYLIDGHNLIPRVRGLSLNEIDDEQELIHRLQAFCRRERKTVEVFFDRAPAGYAGTRAYGPVKAHFVRQGRTADEAIRLRLGQLGKTAAGWTVVSSDRQVQAEARRARAQILSSEEFARMLPAAGEGKQELARKSSAKSKDNDGLSAEELREWLELFGGDEEPERKSPRR